MEHVASSICRWRSSAIWRDYVLLAIFAGLVLWQTRSLRDLLFFGICAGPGLIIQSQNAQPWGIITLFAGAAVGTEILLRFRRLFRAMESWPKGRRFC